LGVEESIRGSLDPSAISLCEYVHDAQSIEIDPVSLRVIKRKTGNTHIRRYKIYEEICDLVVQVWEWIRSRFLVVGRQRPGNAITRHVGIDPLDRNNLRVVQESAPVLRMCLINSLEITVDKCLGDAADLVVYRFAIGIASVVDLGRLADPGIGADQNKQKYK